MIHTALANTSACDKMHSPMAKLDKLASHRRLPASQSASLRPGSLLARHWDLLAVALLMVASFPMQWFSPRILFPIGASINLIDDSWILDSSFKASRGLWFGRDVAFTYGPLFQWLSSAPARLMGLSMGTIYATCATLLVWWTLLFGYLALLLLLPEQPAWKRFLLLLLLTVFWAPWEGRSVLSVFLFVLFLRGWYGLREQALRPALLGCGAGFLCAVAFLYSADSGAYAMAALLISLVGVALGKQGRTAHATFLRFGFTLACGVPAGGDHRHQCHHGQTPRFSLLEKLAGNSCGVPLDGGFVNVQSRQDSSTGLIAGRRHCVSCPRS